MRRNEQFPIEFGQYQKIRCVQCGDPIDQNDPLEWGGAGFACESCVRDYYLKSSTEVLRWRSPAEIEAYLRQEVQYRRAGGMRNLKQILKAQRR